MTGLLRQPQKKHKASGYSLRYWDCTALQCSCTTAQSLQHRRSHHKKSVTRKEAKTKGKKDPEIERETCERWGPTGPRTWETSSHNNNVLYYRSAGRRAAAEARGKGKGKQLNWRRGARGNKKQGWQTQRQKGRPTRRRVFRWLSLFGSP